jgi:hypothetical protein
MNIVRLVGNATYGIVKNPSQSSPGWTNSMWMACCKQQDGKHECGPKWAIYVVFVQISLKKTK